MISEIDIWRTAAEMIKGYGDTADLEVASRAPASSAKDKLQA